MNPDGADGLLYGGVGLFLSHVAALVLVAAYAFLGALAIYKVTDRFLPLRVKEEHEAVGLDLSQHGETAYPSVQRRGLGQALLGGSER